MIVYTRDASWEREFNDAFSSANRMEAGITLFGSIMHSKDADYFRLENPKAGQYSLSFRHDYIDNNDYSWKVTVYSADNVEIGSYGIRSKEALSSFSLQLNAGISFIKVTSYYIGSASFAS